MVHRKLTEKERTKVHGKYDLIYSNWVGDSGRIGMNWAKKELRRLEKKYNKKLKLKIKIGK